MNRRPRWSQVVIALGVIAAIAIAVPAFGVNKSIKKLIRKEVARQIHKATGPPGTDGADGLDGTARAYATVSRGADCSGGPPEATCPITRTKGITSVTQVTSTPGRFCVTAPGIDPHQVPAAVAVDWENTDAPEGNATAMDISDPSCSAGRFAVQTERQPPVAVNASPSGTATVAGNAVNDNGVAFTIVIP